MSVYSYTDSLRVSEQYMYGSSRLGSINPGINMQRTAPAPANMAILSGVGNFNTFTRGNKFFEVSNHLGNVMVVLSDKKVAVQNGTTGTVLYYKPVVKAANDYYPGGMSMPGRKFSSSSLYRYGFGGQEKSDEIKGEGNSYTAQFWEYDPRLMRRWNIDPIDKEYESPYAAFGNNPIWNIDPSGADTAKYISGAQIVDAIRIGYNVINADIQAKKYNVGKDKSKELQTAIDAYAEQHQLEFGAYAEFRETVLGYYKGLNEIAFAKKDAWVTAGRLINEPNISPSVRIRMVIQMANEYNGFGLRIITAGANTAVGLGAGAIGTRAGPGPKGPQIHANTALKPATQYYRGGNNFTFKSNEIRVDENGLVKPTHGVSLFSSPQKIPTKFDTYRITNMPKELKIIQRGNDPQHFEIVPVNPMSKQDFQNHLNQIKTELVPKG